MGKFLWLAILILSGAMLYGETFFEEDFSVKKFKSNFNMGVVQINELPLNQALSLKSVKRSSDNKILQGSWSSPKFNSSNAEFVVIEYWFNPVTPTARYGLLVKNDADKPLITVIQDSKNLKFSNGTNWSSAAVFPVKINKFQRIKYIIDIKKCTYDAYVDDMNIPKAMKLKFRNNNNGAPSRIYTFGSETEPSESLFGGIKITAADKAFNLTSDKDSDAKLILHWDFNEIENGKLKENISGQAADLRGKFTNKNLEKSPYGKAFRFDNGINFANIADTPELSLTDNFTIECIFNPKDVKSYRTIIWKGDRSRSPEAVNYHFGIRDGNIELKWKDLKGEWGVFATTGKPIETNKYYHVIATVKNQTCNIIINGSVAPSTTSAFPSSKMMFIPNHDKAQIGIGTIGERPDAFFNGAIDELKIYQGRYIDLQAHESGEWEKRLEIYNQTLETEKARLKQEEIKALKTQKTDYRKFFDKYKRNSSIGVIPLTAGYKLHYASDFFYDLEKYGSSADLSLARGEYEGGQLIFFAAPGQTEAIESITVSDLKNDNGEIIPATDIKLGKIGFIKADKSDIPVIYEGEIADPIYYGKSDFKILADKFCGVFYQINAKKAKRGIYHGNFTVKSSGGEFNIPLSCHIYDFELPKRSSLKNIFSFDFPAYKKWYNLETVYKAQKLQVFNFFLDYRLSVSELYGDGVSPDFEILPEISERISSIIMPWHFNGNLNESVEKYRDIYEKLKAMNLGDYTYFYSYDELSGAPEKFEKAGFEMAAVRAAYPDLKMMQTSFPRPEIKSMYNVWSPLFDSFSDTKKLECLKVIEKNGGKIWWYTADAPIYPYPNFFLDYPVLDMRIIGLLSYMYEIDGLLYWRINREWVSNLEKAPTFNEKNWRSYIYNSKTKSRKYKNGMGNFVYPGENGELLPSLRLENLRDGLEDYEYMVLLKNKLDTYKTIKGEDEFYQKAKKSLNVPENVAIKINDYSANPMNLQKYRNHIAGIIENLNHNLEK